MCMYVHVCACVCARAYKVESMSVSVVPSHWGIDVIHGGHEVDLHVVRVCVCVCVWIMVGVRVRARVSVDYG